MWLPRKRLLQGTKQGSSHRHVWLASILFFSPSVFFFMCTCTSVCLTVWNEDQIKAKLLRRRVWHVSHHAGMQRFIQIWAELSWHQRVFIQQLCKRSTRSARTRMNQKWLFLEIVLCCLWLQHSDTVSFINPPQSCMRSVLKTYWSFKERLNTFYYHIFHIYLREWQHLCIFIWTEVTNYPTYKPWERWFMQYGRFALRLIFPSLSILYFPMAYVHRNLHRSVQRGGARAS